MLCCSLKNSPDERRRAVLSFIMKALGLVMRRMKLSLRRFNGLGPFTLNKYSQFRALFWVFQSTVTDRLGKKNQINNLIFSLSRKARNSIKLRKCLGR